MALSKQKEKIYILYAVIAFLAAGYVHFFRDQFPVLYIAVTAFVYFSVILLWEIVVRHRIMWAEMRRHMTATAVLMLVWTIISLFMAIVSPEHPTLGYFLYHSYYPLLSSIFVEVFLASICVYKNAKFVMPLSWKLLHLPGAIISYFVISNDLQCCMSALQLDLPVSVSPDNYGLLSNVMIIWLIFVVVCIFVHIAIRASKMHREKEAIGVLAILVIGYFTLLNHGIIGKALFEHFYSISDLVCILVLFFWTMFINMGVVPSNRDYIRFFENFTTPAVLTDYSGQYRIESKNGSAISQEVIEKMGDIPDVTVGNRRMHKKSVPGGYLVWEEDLSEIIECNRKIEDLASVIGEENEVRLAMDNILSRQAEVIARDKLYSNIYSSIQHVIMLTEQRLNSLKPDDSKFNFHLAFLCVLAAYMKRRCNMVLLSAESDTIDVLEIKYSLQETSRYMDLYGTDFSYSISFDGLIPSNVAISIYDSLHAVFYSSLPDVNAIMMNVVSRDDTISTRINIDSDVFNKIFFPHMPENSVIEEAVEDSTRYVTIKYYLGKKVEQ